PPELAEQIEVTMYCGHFFCHVLHQEYLVKKGRDCAALKRRLLALLEARGARYPAEHNVGHLYQAAPELEQHYRQLDPTNAFNPGIGQLTRRHRWQEDCCATHSGDAIAAAAKTARAETAETSRTS
ncbi:MAG TPA: D-lactate dehydrogenase, partial [Pseudomonas sp.]|nr:D-lactate dehydrogenase [Pseudomonas sp.]